MPATDPMRWLSANETPLCERPASTFGISANAFRSRILTSRLEIASIDANETSLPMKSQPWRAILAFCLSLFAGPALLHGQDVSFEVLTEFGYPGAHATSAYGINDAGDVVGAIALDQVGYSSGFARYADGTLSEPIFFPGSDVIETVATAINNAGTIAGWYVNSTGPHGFFLSDGVYTSYDAPDAIATLINGINDAGDFVGRASRTQGVYEGFANVGGKFYQLTIPDVTYLEPTDITNEGDIVGFASSGGPSGGFLRGRNGVVRSPLQRESGVSDQLNGANERREAVGQETGSSGLYYGGRDIYAIYNFPTLINNALTGINRGGVICGSGFSVGDLKIYSYLVQRVRPKTAE